MIDIRSIDKNLLIDLLESSQININGVIKEYSKDDVLKALDNNNYVNIVSNINNKDIILETPFINEKLDSMLGKYNTIEECQKIINNICYDYKLLMEAINLGVQLPRKISINESYNKDLNSKFKKYGQGLRNIYDYMIYRIL